MVEKADASVAHPDTMVIDSERALGASLAVLGPRRHHLFTSLAIREFADLRHGHDGTTTRV